MTKPYDIMLNAHVVPADVWDVFQWDLLRLKGIDCLWDPESVCNVRAYAPNAGSMMFVEFNKAAAKKREGDETFQTHAHVGGVTWHIECEMA